MRFPKARLGISLHMSVFYEISTVLKANYLSSAHYATLRSALVFDECSCFEQFSNHYERKLQ